ncbi:protein kinase [Metabacillus sp. DBTR6]|uniref:Protein kinase n=1 Tax=Metabacillus rhizolycopersici TaxID=2875709 RepID=A0ABS7UYN3_9BACI|nr:protein kinase [Metabacillus rhizolycopersici]MBZ5753441.1 protein kinase [Metabacillus rhizolycopersici]
MRAIRKFYQFFVDKPIKKGVVLKDRYEILSVIGTGSYGIVYLCRYLKTNENKVIKQLRPSKRRKEVEMFENEISVLRMLNHKNIPILFEAFSNNGSLFYVMSFIEGDNLEDKIFLRKNTFNENESLLILSHLLELVDYLHKKDIYHQDLRIPNMLLKNNELFLIDFGLSKHKVAVAPFHSPLRSLPNKQDEILEMKLQDYYDLGEILLYLLYTTYSSKNKKALPWTEELSLKKETVYLLKRLLQIKEPYSNTSEISTDLKAALKVTEKRKLTNREED